jgi:C-terminal peptidase prc
MKKPAQSKLSFIFTLILLAGGCNNSHNHDAPENSTSDQSTPIVDYQPASCEPEDTKAFVHRVMRDVYFWSDTIPENVNYADFETPEQLLKFLRYKERDHFSLLLSKSDAQQFQDGQQLGTGLVPSYGPSPMPIQSVLANSSAKEAGIERGDAILQINGKTIDELKKIIQEHPEITDEQIEELIWGPNKEGAKVDLVIKKHNVPKDEQPVNITLTKTIFTPPTVSKTDIMEVDGQKVGYLVFDTFARTSAEELTQSFAQYKSEGISELVLDLRYNLGGDTDPLFHLASLIWGYNSGSEEFSKVYFNEKHASLNFSVPFTQVDNRLELNRVFVLTGPYTASASEILINNLKPYMEVIQIGRTTYGKPYGMHTLPFCNKVLAPVTVETKNALDEGEYYDGIKPDCPVDDDLDHKLGDKSEGLLSEALYYMANGQCSEQSSALRSSPSSKQSTSQETEDLLRRLNRPQTLF